MSLKRCRARNPNSPPHPKNPPNFQQISGAKGNFGELKIDLSYSTINEFILLPRTISSTGELLVQTRLPSGEMVNIEDRSIWTQIVVNLPAPASEGLPATTSKPSTPTITELRASGGYIHVGWGKGPGTTDVDSFVIARVENGQHLNPRHAKEDQRSATFPAKAATYDIGVAAVNDVTKWPDLWNQEPVLSEFVWKRLVVGDDDQSLGVPLTGPFDSIATLPNGKTYATFRHLYVRYSGASANRIDVGYPKPIAGNWGALPPAFFAGFLPIRGVLQATGATFRASSRVDSTRFVRCPTENPTLPVAPSTCAIQTPVPTRSIKATQNH
ncbi:MULTISPECIES: hypothetical protein [unclassified Mesorhizobium]|uniref:hypothetical protein n=1 Tax=unclassified Mesorhizobium TaxID=325217 RepID=UPI00333B8151